MNNPSFADAKSGVLSMVGLPPAARQAAADALHRELAGEEGQRGLTLLSAADILSTAWPEPRWAVPGLIPVGLVILAGRPKLGKSWLALQLACTVASGGVFLGQRVAQGKVLYLALEDTPRRLQDRMRIQQWPDALPVDFLSLGGLSQIGPIDRGGADVLSQLMTKQEYRLVVIDTLTRACLGKDVNDSRDMASVLEPLQAAALSCNSCILLIDHHAKARGTAPDAVDNVLGATSKAGIADAALGLYRERGKREATLQVTGRDIDERTLAVVFDGQTGTWELQGEPGTPALTDRHQRVLAALEGDGGRSHKDLCAATDIDKGNLSRALADLTNLGLVTRTEESGGPVYRRVKGLGN